MLVNIGTLLPRHAIYRPHQTAVIFQDDERVIRDFVRQSLVPYPARAGVPLNRVYDVIYPDRPDPVVSDAEALSIYARVVRDSEFRSLLAYRHNWELDRQGSFRSTLRYVEGVLALLEAELDG